MSNSAHLLSAHLKRGREQALQLTSLAPEFNDDQHGVYYRLLLQAISKARHRNIALTGAYGAGKSSVLQRLVEERPSKVVVLSLSTIGPENYDTTRGEKSQPQGFGGRTQEIQKEVVKQLLYRLKPSKVPQSRFRRPDLPRRLNTALIAIGVAVSLFAATLVLGFDFLHPYLSNIFPEVWRQGVAYGLSFVLLTLIAWVFVRLARLRPRMSASVNSGIATVTLSNAEDSYFDAYLDEIVYFFQASRAEIVIIEDIDRFEDVQVFDTLRALNSLLNGSKQVGRRVVFIYAIRDSVFERIGSSAAEEEQKGDESPNPMPKDHALESLKRASRTKFFDQIIPVVPFVSADNARDLMSDVMESKEFVINPALIRLAARHVADMRLIHNIRNEFDVYRQRLIVPEGRVPGITDDLLFALVLYKNTHLADFEKIRHRESKLDALFMFWRKLVNEELRRHSHALAKLQRKHQFEASVEARAERLGASLLHLRDTLQRSAEDAPATVELAGPATDDNLSDPEIWVQIAAGEEQRITISSGSGRYASEVGLSFSAPQLADLLGAKIDEDEWRTLDTQSREVEIAQEMEHVDFLKHRAWKELAKSDDFHATFAGLSVKLPTNRSIDERVTFDTAVEVLLESDLARDLVRNGYLTSHFAIYSASYYGTHLGPEAREYLWRCIEPGTPDAMFEISETQVEQLLREQGADKNDQAELFDDASVFNVSIVNYLLDNRMGAATTVARRLACMGDEEREFVAFYAAHGAAADRLFRLMAPHWPEILAYVVNATTLATDVQLSLLNAALGAIPHAGYVVDDNVTAFIERNYERLSAVVAPASLENATRVFAILKAGSGKIRSLESVNSDARKAAVESNSYPLTPENYRVLMRTGAIGLDTLASIPAAYRYTLNNLGEFLTLVQDGDEGIEVIVDPASFVRTINDAWSYTSKEHLTDLIKLANGRSQVDVLEEVEQVAWPALVSTGRTVTSLKNVSAFVEVYGVTQDLGDLLRKHKEVSGWAGVPQDQRRTVAVAILNASDVIPSTYIRVGIAKKLEPGTLDPDELRPQSGDLVARLITRKLLLDDETAFSKRLMVDWSTLKPTIMASKMFKSFVSPELIDVTDLTRIVRDKMLPSTVVKVFLPNLAEFLAGASRPQIQALTAAFIEKRWRMTRPILETLVGRGASPGQIMRLIHLRGSDLANDEIRSTLRLLGGKYAQVADVGSKRPSFAYDEAHAYVFQRLVGVTVRAVKESQMKAFGRSLTVQLM